LDVSPGSKLKTLVIRPRPEASASDTVTRTDRASASALPPAMQAVASSQSIARRGVCSGDRLGGPHDGVGRSRTSDHDPERGADQCQDGRRGPQTPLSGTTGMPGHVIGDLLPPSR
jgi:hypothetical protein